MKALLNIVFATAVLTGGILANTAQSQAGWIYTNHGNVYCNYSYGYADCR